jgi:hypothetical protein
VGIEQRDEEVEQNRCASERRVHDMNHWRSVEMRLSLKMRHSHNYAQRTIRNLPRTTHDGLVT